MSTNFSDLLYREEKGVATITINRPKVLNAFTAHTVEELIQAFLKAGWNKGIGVIVLTGVGDRRLLAPAATSLRTSATTMAEGTNGMPIEELQSLIRDVPKP
jgi:2-ketocyclohexanecarboxyl-CoA hydrolase